MARYAVMDGIRVTNVILAEDVQTANEVTGKLCIEVPDYVSVGYVYIEDGFYKEHVFGMNNNLKLLETQNPTGTDLGTAKHEDYIGYDELNTKLEEEKTQIEQNLNI